MPTVIIPFPLRIHCNNQREVLLEGNTLSETMDRLFKKHPGLKVVGDDCRLLSVFVNNKLTNTGMDQWDQLSLNKDDEIAFIIPICGG